MSSKIFPLQGKVPPPPRSLSNKMIATQDWVLSIYYARGIEQIDQPLERKIWQKNNTLTIGHPVKWFLQRDSRGVIVRHLNSEFGQIKTDQHFVLNYESVIAGKVIELPGQGAKKQRAFISIQPKRSLEPIYSTALHDTTSKTNRFHVFKCINGVIQFTQVCEGRSIITDHNKAIAEIIETGSEFIITAKDKEISIQQPNKEVISISSKEKHALARKDFFQTTIVSDKSSWKFSPALSPEIAAVPTPFATPEIPWAKSENKSLRKSAKIAAAIAIIATIVMFAIPKHEVTEEEKKEIIPAQYTKIIMTKMKKPAGPKKATTQSSAKKAAKAKRAAVVKAFRNKAVKRSMSNLLKGGMTRLLSNTNIIKKGVSNRTTTSLFKATANSKTGNSNLTKLAKSSLDGVATLGGKDGKLGALSAVGYGSGQEATISGQGDGFVDLEGEGAEVAQGLTRDEVGRVIHKHISEVRYCYESAMVRNPAVQGKLVADFNIGPAGRVTWSKSNESSLNDPQLDNCIIRRLNTWKFPKPKGGVNVAVSYPFILKTLGR